MLLKVLDSTSAGGSVQEAAPATEPLLCPGQLSAVAGRLCHRWHDELGVHREPALD